jgi:hypothetical protein
MFHLWCLAGLREVKGASFWWPTGGTNLSAVEKSSRILIILANMYAKPGVPDLCRHPTADCVDGCAAG